jgi:hypothetical protein
MKCPRCDSQRIKKNGSIYEEVFPSKRHKAVGKETGKTNHIERFGREFQG